ncbi:rod shape-determining protein RodA [Candidatus Aerophobetes bacterium]|nr:rod shape-determining protein RodA [Candidatus Aerophobetes bacterium]
MLIQQKRKIDRYILLSTLFLVSWGLLHLYTISLPDLQSYFQRQLIWAGIGIFLLVFFYFLPVSLWPKIAWFLYILSFIFLLTVLVKGQAVWGARRWLQIGNIGFQPSEFTKISLIILLAKLLAQKEEINWRRVLFTLLLTFFPVFLIALQPDLGTAIVIFLLCIIMLFVAGISLKKLIFLTGAIFALIPFVYLSLRPYQKTRIIAFLNPQKDPLGTGWSTLQSKIAFGSGRIWGKGIGEAAHTKLKFLPQPFTDFIFSSMGEQWGFVGICLIIVAYLVLIIRGIMLSLEKDKSFCGLFAAGFTSLIAVQATVNMAVACGLIPVTGIPLPILSYGGSSLILFLSGIGILLACTKDE